LLAIHRWTPGRRAGRRTSFIGRIGIIAEDSAGTGERAAARPPDRKRNASALILRLE